MLRLCAQENWDNEPKTFSVSSKNINVKTAFNEFYDNIMKSTENEFDFSLFVPVVKFDLVKSTNFSEFQNIDLFTKYNDEIWGCKEMCDLNMCGKYPFVESKILSTNLSELPDFVYTEGFPNVLHVKNYQRGYQEIEIITLTGKKFKVLTTWSSPIEAIKKQIGLHAGIPEDQQRLIGKGKQLEDDRSLADYGIVNNDSLHLTLRLRGGMYDMSSGVLFTTPEQPTGKLISLSPLCDDKRNLITCFSKRFYHENTVGTVYFQKGCAVSEIFDFVSQV